MSLCHGLLKIWLPCVPVKEWYSFFPLGASPFLFGLEHSFNMACHQQAFHQTPMVPIRAARADQLERTLFDLHSQVQGQIQLLIIILPDFSGTYGVYT